MRGRYQIDEYHLRCPLREVAPPTLPTSIQERPMASTSYRLIDPVTSAVELETADRNEVDEFINDPLMTGVPLVVETLIAGKVENIQNYNLGSPAFLN